MEEKYLNLISKKKEKKKVRKDYTEKEQALFMCDHKNANKRISYLGVLDKNNPNNTRCEKCGAKVNTEVMDQMELTQATEMVINALQCVKFAKEDITTIELKAIGQIIAAMKDLPYQYKINFANKVNNKLNENVDDSDDDEDTEDINGPQYLFTSGSDDNHFVRKGNNNHHNKNKNKKKYKKRKGYFNI